jgi:hypothetical protein
MVNLTDRDRHQPQRSPFQPLKNAIASQNSTKIGHIFQQKSLN